MTPAPGLEWAAILGTQHEQIGLGFGCLLETCVQDCDAAGDVQCGRDGHGAVLVSMADQRGGYSGGTNRFYAIASAREAEQLNYRVIVSSICCIRASR
jgi:hypothetical protein